MIPGTSPKVRAWRCSACGTDWAVTVVAPCLRPFLDQLAEDVVTRSVLREVSTLAERADTLTPGQLRARLVGCLGRLDQACSRGADASAASGSLAGHRPDNEVPDTQPVPRSTVAAPESGGTGTVR